MLPISMVLALPRPVPDHSQTDFQGDPPVFFPLRPLLAVPHILADESSAYYHGYVLAEMSVHQTRAHFKSKFGAIADNPEVGKQLTEVQFCLLSNPTWRVD